MTLADYLDQPGITAIAVSRRIGVAHSTVLRWAARRVPATRVQEVAQATGIPASDLRPDLAAAFAPREVA